MIISVLNTKGGVGKSTVSINLAVAWAAEGYDTLLIDTDEEGTSLDWYGRREAETDSLTVVSMPSAAALKKSIKGLVQKHHVVIIDGAPSLHELLTASAWISTLVLIPVKPSPNDLWKLRPMVERLRDVQQLRAQGGLKGPLLHFLVNENVDRTRLSKEVVTALQAYELPVLSSRLNTRMDYRDSFNQGLSALEYSNPKARAEVHGLFGEVKGLLELLDKPQAPTVA